MAYILGKDLDNWEDSIITREPYSATDKEQIGAQYITGNDLLRSAKISSDWKAPVAIYAQAYKPISIPAQVAWSTWHGMEDTIHNLPYNVVNTIAQRAVELTDGEEKPKHWTKKLLEGTEIGQLEKMGMTLAAMGIVIPGMMEEAKTIKEKAKTYDEMVDLLNERDYPLSKYAQRVIADTTNHVENRRLVRELYNQAQGIDSEAWYNQAGTIIGAMIPTIVASKWGYSSALASGAGRANAINTAMNIAKGYMTAEMAGQYAEETAAQYLRRTGDKNFENFTAKDASGLSAMAYGAIGAQIEFIGGIEPIMAGALQKVGLRSGLVKAGLKIAGGEATEELLQNVTELLMRKMEGSTDKTWGEGIKDALNGAVWGAFIGGLTGSPAFYVNRRNLVRGIKKALPQVSDAQATQIADAMIDTAAEASSQDQTLRNNLREKVSYMYKNIDLDNKEDRIDAITDLEYALATMDATDRGIDLTEHEIFQGEVTPIGWFRAGIPEAQRTDIQAIIDNITDLQTQLETLNKAKEKDWAKIEEIENKLAQANQYVLDKLSDLISKESFTRTLENLEKKYVAKQKKKAGIPVDTLETTGKTYTDAEILGMFTKAKNDGSIKLDNWENVRWSSLLSAGDTYQKGKRNKPATEAEKAKFARKMLDKYMPGWNTVETTQQKPMFQEQFDLADENARLDDIYPAYDGETIEVDGKERTVYNSNGDRIAKSKEALTNFWRWFGDSKVVDSKDRPIVMYHGTRSMRWGKELPKFNEFSRDKLRSGQNSVGFFFGESVDFVKNFGDRIIPVYLKLSNPKIYKKGVPSNADLVLEQKLVDNATRDDEKYYYQRILNDTKKYTDPYDKFVMDMYHKSGFIPYQSRVQGNFNDAYFLGREESKKAAEKYMQSLKDEGFDGIIILDTEIDKNSNNGQPNNQYVVFDSTQIKSVDNRGTFSADTGNIYWQSAYAGSAVDYDRPSLEAIGSGEGTAAHGWGLYYALDPEIAENYMYASRASYEANKIMSLDQEFETLKVDGKPILDVYDIDIDRTLLDLLAWKPYGVVEEELDKRISKWEQLSKDPDYKFKDYADKKVNAYKRLKSDLYNNGMSLIQKDRGQVHEVDIPEMVDLLDEQKNYAEQSEYVKKVLRNMLYSVRFQEYYQEGQTAEDFVNQEITDWEQGFNGGQIYDRISNLLGGDKEASLLMEEYGIKGITYDGRQDGRCFVIFNPESVKVLRKKFDELGNVLFQNRVSGAAPSTYRGAYIPEYRFILRANKMDASTLSHEMAHDWFETNFYRYRNEKMSNDFMKAWGALEKALGVTEKDNVPPRKASEAFARAYEAWITSNEDWHKLINVDDKDKDAVAKLMQDYQNSLRDIYNDISNPYFKETWGKLGELKPDLKAWFDRVVNITDLDVLVERGEMTEEQATNEKLNRAIDTVIENTTDEETAQTLKEVRTLNDTKRYEVEGGNKNSIQQRLSALAKEIDENNMISKGSNYDTRRDMMAVAEAADNFVKTRFDDALAIINGQMAEVEGLFKEDLYTALERLAIENGDLGLIDELKNSEIANRLAKELGQRVAGFRNFKQSTDLDVVSALKSLDNKFNEALKNKKAKQEYETALKSLEESIKQQDKVADKELDSFLKDLECK